MSFSGKYSRAPARTAQRLRLKHGFTLIETLIVIALIAILASILIPLAGRVQRKAGLVQCNSNMRQLGLSIILYAQNNRNQLPGASSPYWDYAAMDYITEGGAVSYSKTLACPADGIERTGANADLVRSYSFNAALCNFGGQFTNVTDWGVNAPAANVGMKLEMLPNASRTALLIEKHDLLNVYNSGAWVAAASLYDVHDGSMNVVYCDGHVETIGADMDVWAFRRNHLSRGKD